MIRFWSSKQISRLDKKKLTQKDSFQSSFSENFIFLIEFLSQQDLLVYKNCIETLLTILQNILKSSEEKFRKIKN
jgi:PUB domain.